MPRIGKTPSRIFINYRRGDAAGFAGRLSDALGRYFGDGRVFRDIDGIEGGANFEAVLKPTAQAADAMIVLIGRDWMTMTNKSGQRRLHEPDDWVAREIAAGLERKIPVFLVLIENAAMPRAEELPESLKPLVRHNAISLSDNRWRYVYAGGLVGLLGSCACFVWLGPLDDATEPVAMFFGSTITAITVLILMNLSGFKAR